MKLKHNSNNLEVIVKLSSKELSLMKTSIALTISSIIDAQKKSEESVSIDQQTLRQLFERLTSLQFKLPRLKEGDSRKN